MHYLGLMVLGICTYERLPVVMQFKWKAIHVCILTQLFCILAWALLLRAFIPYDSSNYDFGTIEWWRILAAGLEDAVYILPVFLLDEDIRILPLIMFAILFAGGHSYQGTFPALAKLPYVFVGYFLAKKYGIWTTMAAHSLNDVIAFSTERFLTSHYFTT